MTRLIEGAALPEARSRWEHKRTGTIHTVKEVIHDDTVLSFFVKNGKHVRCIHFLPRWHEIMVPEPKISPELKAWRERQQPMLKLLKTSIL